MTILTVKELRAIIAHMPDDSRVVLQSDAGGNEFRWARGAELDGIIVKDHEWSPEIYNASWNAVDAVMDEDEWNKLLTNPKVLVIHPVN